MHFDYHAMYNQWKRGCYRHYLTKSSDKLYIAWPLVRLSFIKFQGESHLITINKKLITCKFSGNKRHFKMLYYFAK